MWAVLFLEYIVWNKLIQIYILFYLEIKQQFLGLFLEKNNLNLEKPPMKEL